jgi:mono/diheme cytochrome c family protein
MPGNGAGNGDDAEMRSIHLQAAALAAICLAPVCLMPGAARADATAGARMALQWCANCHVVNAASGGGPAATIPQGPPAFATIAGRLTPDRMRAFLSHPHGAMPDLALTRAEINDLIDYIQTLQ